MGRVLISAAIVTKISHGKGTSIYTRGLILGGNLIIAVIVARLSQRIGTLKYTLGLILGRILLNDL